MIHTPDAPARAMRASTTMGVAAVDEGLASMPRRPGVLRFALGLLVALTVPVMGRAQTTPGNEPEPAPPAGTNAGTNGGDDEGLDPGPPPSGDESGAGEGDDNGGGGGDAQLPVAPEPPVSELTPEQRRLLVPSQGETPNRDDSGNHRFFFPPYLHEWGRGHHTRVLFPVYFDSQYRDDRTVVIPPYYHEHSPTLDVDAFAPFYFRFRGHRVDPTAPPPAPGQTPAFRDTWATDIVGPAWYYRSRGPGRAQAINFGAVPFFSYGATFNEQGTLQREHLIIPWALTYHQWLPDTEITVVGPYVYHRDHTTTDWAVVPFVIRHVTPQREWTVIPPLLTYHRVDHEDNSQFTLVGPVFWESGPDFASYNLAPIFFHWHNRTSSRTTLLPFFHTESGVNRFTLITPLGGYSREGSESTTILPFYQNHRGISNLDAVAPFFFYQRTPRLRSWTLAMPPLMFASGSPTGYSWGVFPIIGRWHQYGRSDTTATLFFVHSTDVAARTSTTWVFPGVHFHSAPNYHLRNIYPLFFSETREHRNHYAVLFPFYWDIGDEVTGRRVTVVAPFYMRMATPTTLAEYYFPNFVRWRQDRAGVRYDGWDFAPFVQYQSAANHDVAWSVLEGLVGYRRAGSYEQVRVLYFPIQLHSATPTPAPQSRHDHDTVIRM